MTIAIEMKKFFTIATCVAFSMGAVAQSGTNSPYSQYGFGSLNDQATGFNKGMNGVGLGFRDGGQVNVLNPASYSAVDSLTFIFDVGMSGQITSFEENGKRLNAKNANFEYAVAAFRLFKHVGMSFGLRPLSNVGYSYANTSKVGDTNSTTYTNTYKGSGGIRQLYLGMGFQLFKGFSLGANAAYAWGELDRSVVNSYNDSYVNTLSKYYNVQVSNLKFDFGAQFVIPFSKKNSLTLGVTYGLEQSMKADPECKVISTNSQTTVADTTKYVVKDGIKFPTTIGAGAMLNLGNRLRIGADYSLQKWASVGFPEYSVKDNTPSYAINKDYFKDRHKVNLGFEYCRNANARNFFSRLRFRAGASYTTPYLNINGHDGPKEISVSAGLGIPIINLWNNRSMLNISGQWVRMDASNLLKENTFRINIGITFNERWFMKWKVD